MKSGNAKGAEASSTKVPVGFMISALPLGPSGESQLPISPIRANRINKIKNAFIVKSRKAVTRSLNLVKNPLFPAADSLILFPVDRSLSELLRGAIIVCLLSPSRSK